MPIASNCSGFSTISVKTACRRCSRQAGPIIPPSASRSPPSATTISSASSSTITAPACRRRPAKTCSPPSAAPHAPAEPASASPSPASLCCPTAERLPLSKRPIVAPNSASKSPTAHSPDRRPPRHSFFLSWFLSKAPRRHPFFIANLTPKSVLSKNPLFSKNCKIHCRKMTI